MSRQAPLSARLKALDEAATLSAGRSADAAVANAARVVQHANKRVAFSGDHTVVALAGATGSGKSSTFNAVSGTEFASTGVRRPTTSQAMAVAWGPELPGELLDWLDVPRRHLVASSGTPFANLVLLDLPDHDSTEAEHRVTVDRLVELVDMLVWVVDPQKYADAALHNGYLKPLAPYAEVMVVVLNQADRLWGDELEAAMADLRRLLDSEGLQKTRILSMSALEGTGVPELRALLAQAVEHKRAFAERLSADVSVAADALATELGSAPTPTIAKAVRERLVDSLADAAGVPIATEGVRRAWRHRGGLATGWPFVNWVARLKPDPLRALRLDQRSKELSPTAVSRTSLPAANSVQRARVDRGLRELVDAAANGLPRGWGNAVREAARGREALVLDRLDAAIGGTDLELDRGHAWWGLVRFLQWVFMVAALAGVLWTVGTLLLPTMGMVDIPAVLWWGWPAQFILLAGGVGGGLLLAGLSGIGVALGARYKASRAERILDGAIAAVTDAEVVAPVQEELDRHSRAVAAVKAALTR